MLAKGSTQMLTPEFFARLSGAAAAGFFWVPSLVSSALQQAANAAPWRLRPLVEIRGVDRAKINRSRARTGRGRVCRDRRRPGLAATSANRPMGCPDHDQRPAASSSR